MKGKILAVLVALVTVQMCLRQAHGQSGELSCLAAGYTSCCTSDCQISGGCSCEIECHTSGTCCEDIDQICPGLNLTTIMPEPSFASETPIFKTIFYSKTVLSGSQQITVSPQPTTESFYYSTPHISTTVQATLSVHIPTSEEERGCSGIVRASEVVAWVLVVVLIILLTVTLTVYTIVLVVYRQRHMRQFDLQAPVYEMEGNPCYEATQVTLTMASEMEPRYEAL